MDKKINIVFVAAFCVFAALLYAAIFAADWGSASADQASEGIRPSKPTDAPDFTLPDLSGKPVRLSDYKGKVVFLNFWATWCAPCRIEIPSIKQLQYEFEGKDFVLQTVSIDQGGRAVVEEFFRQLGINMPTVVDADSRVAGIYGLTGVPESFLIDRRGRIVGHFVGPRDWTDPAFLKEIERLLQAPKSI